MKDLYKKIHGQWRLGGSFEMYDLAKIWNKSKKPGKKLPNFMT